jgi:hypothetical protein
MIFNFCDHCFFFKKMIIINQMGTGLFTVEFPRTFNVMQHNILKVQIAR